MVSAVTARLPFTLGLGDAARIPMASTHSKLMRCGMTVESTRPAAGRVASVEPRRRIGLMHLVSIVLAGLPATGRAETRPVQLVASKTTATPQGNVCPKNYTMTFRVRSNTVNGPITYRFVRSDGSQSAPASVTLSRMKETELSTEWQIGESVKDGWIAIQFEGMAPQRLSTFTMTCGGSGRGSVVANSSGGAVGPKDPANGGCPSGWTWRAYGGGKYHSCFANEGSTCPQAYPEFVSNVGVTLCGYLRTSPNDHCAAGVAVVDAQNRQHCPSACGPHAILIRPDGDGQFHCERTPTSFRN